MNKSIIFLSLDSTWDFTFLLRNCRFIFIELIHMFFKPVFILHILLQEHFLLILKSIRVSILIVLQKSTSFSSLLTVSSYIWSYLVIKSSHHIVHYKLINLYKYFLKQSEHLDLIQSNSFSLKKSLNKHLLPINASYLCISHNQGLHTIQSDC